MRRAKLAETVVYHTPDGNHWAAIVTVVQEDGTVDLTLFPPNLLPRNDWKVEYGFDPGQFHFPGESLA